MEDTTQPVPTPVVENTEQPETTDQPEQVKEPESNLVTIPAERLQDYKRKINGSREEAMRLKDKAEKLEAELAAAKTVKYPESDVEQLRILARQAGIPLKEDMEQYQRNSYEEEKQTAVLSFLEKHPEYAQMGDAQSDEMWETLESEVKNYVNPPRGKDYLQLMEKAHRVIHYNPEIERERGKALGMAQAKIQESTTIGGGSGRQSVPVRKGSQQKSAIMDGFAAVRPQAFNS